MRGRKRFARAIFGVALLGALAVPAAARADVLDKIQKRVLVLDSEASDLERSIKPPSEMQTTDDIARRRLVEAQVAYGMGSYADASILLYDVVERFPQSPSWKEAVFYLADSLFMKGDNLTARDYFRKVVLEFGEGDPNYPKALERLLELSLRLKDDEGVPDLLARIDRIPEAKRSPSAPYVRGKYAYFKGDYDVAIKSFDGIDQGSPYYFQARYFLGAAYVAKGELPTAAKIFSDLLKVPVKDKNQARIVELTHMALGRIHYERDQPQEAIEQYLMISRKSDLFDDALYEVAFVYVKARQFDKALRALELLELATGGSCEKNNSVVKTVEIMPEICILKGNLAVRRGQQIVETSNSSPVEEYSSALAIFENTRTAYQGPRDELEKIIKDNADAHQYFAVITADGAFDSAVQLPEVARYWIRQEPEVARVVNMTTDLASIRKDLEDTEQLIARLERIINSPNRVQVFPSLAEKRARIVDILDEAYDLRQQLATHERALVAKYASAEEKAALDQLYKKRQELSKQLADLPNSGGKYEERLAKARQQYEELDKQAQELEVLISSMEAELAALEKYYGDMTREGKSTMDPALFKQSMAEIRADIAAMRKELDAVRAELVIAKDQAGIDDDLAAEERRLRKELNAVVHEEHEYMRRITARMNGGDADKAREIDATVKRIEAIEAACERANAKIEKILDVELATVRADLDEAKRLVATYKAQLAEYEGENYELGSELIKGSFGTVSKRFYEITVRAEVGVIDVNWAEKEESEARFERIEKESAREKRQLEADFSDVANEPEPTAKPPAPAPAPAPAAPPSEGDNGQP
jgi:tetratricopeptide (TPR) repeat protein